MQCYSCGNELTEKDYCTACGADVGFYKNIHYLSLKLYNEGLDRARVRDLSGAARCLRESISLNKNNIDARNLLGLVYYETGEVVAALIEWVISKNLREEKNLAGDYLAEMQKDPQRLETLGRTAKKFNLALRYAEQESYDLAVIQLKRILQLNPGFLRARQLLALLYIRSGDFDRAKHECARCLRIDSGDTVARRYMREADTESLPGIQTNRRREAQPVRYQSGNEMIIQPPSRGPGAGVWTFGAAVAGICAGIAVAWFLILPARATRIREAARGEIAAVCEESDAKSAQITDLERKISKLESTISEMEKEQESAEEVDYHSATALLEAVSAYLKTPEDLGTVSEILLGMEVDAPELKDEGAAALYDAFTDMAGEELAEKFRQAGLAAFREEDDETAVKNLLWASELKSDDPEVLFILGRAYYRSGDNGGAREAFEKLVSDFPDTKEASQAQDLLAEINNTVDQTD
ncbi:MAG: tetratricopeptide repeat protein [Lachnospiraceae bacterium]|nr:tetratricopeptide repeat protein [Lachnospiraceae bacterium]